MYKIRCTEYCFDFRTFFHLNLHTVESFKNFSITIDVFSFPIEIFSNTVDDLKYQGALNVFISLLGI